MGRWGSHESGQGIVVGWIAYLARVNVLTVDQCRLYISRVLCFPEPTNFEAFMESRLSLDGVTGRYFGQEVVKFLAPC